MADGDSHEIVRALGHIARARRMAALAKESGLGMVLFEECSDSEGVF
jgi:DNA-binding phage protein